MLPGIEAVHPGLQGYLDLSAGAPDPVTGLAFVDVTGSSEYIAIDLNPGAPFTFCMRPINLPVVRAGVVNCTGGEDFGVRLTQDHRIGQVGVDGFQQSDCAEAGGSVEPAGSPHPGVCNGPIESAPSGEPDSGAGALKIGFDAVLGLQGLPVELSIEEAPPCGDEPGISVAVLGFVSALARAEIENADDGPNSLAHELRGESFSCQAWAQENGPGRLVVALPALHGFLGADLILGLVLDD